MKDNLYSIAFRVLLLSMFILPSIAAAQHIMFEAPLDTCYHENTSHHTRVEKRNFTKGQNTRVQTATFQVNYSGFSPEAKAAFEYALQIWGSVLVSDVPIKIDASFENSSSSFLAYAGARYMHSNFASTVQKNTTYPDALADAIAGKDLAPTSAYDIYIKFNDKYNWHYGADLNPSSSQVDFVTLALHELGHGLGFTAWYNYLSSGEGSLRLYNQYPSSYSNMLVDGGDKQLVSYSDPSLALGQTFTSNGVYAAGSHTLEQNSGIPARVYAPSTWKNGSSIIHLDESTYPAGSEHSIMTPRFGYAEANHYVSPLIVGMLQDMGWPLSTTTTTPDEPTDPEPPTEPTDQDLRAADSPVNPTKGMNFRYYEGNFKSMPNFSRLTAKKQGISAGLSLSTSRADAFAFYFEGYFYAKADGIYQFSVDADQGASVYIGDQLLLSSGAKGKQSDQLTNSIGLEAGYHQISVEYYEWKGGEKLLVQCSPPQSSYENVNGNLFYDAGSAAIISENSTRVDTPSSLELFPNPTSGVVQLQWDYWVSGETAKVKVLDHYGYELYSKSVGKGDPTIDISELSRGIYLLIVENSVGIKTTKLVKH